MIHIKCWRYFTLVKVINIQKISKINADVVVLNKKIITRIDIGYEFEKCTYDKQTLFSRWNYVNQSLVKIIILESPLLKKCVTFELFYYDCKNIL